MAYRLMRSGKSEEAVREFESYFAIRPDDTKARSDYMNLLYGLGRFDQAKEQARQVLSASREEVEHWNLFRDVLVPGAIAGMLGAVFMAAVASRQARSPAWPRSAAPPALPQ